MQEIWYKNKPTLIKALVTLVLFMVLSNVAKGIRGDHENALQIHEEKSVVLAQKLQGLNGVVDVERKSRSALEDRAKDLFSKVAISARPVHSIPDNPDSIVTEFKRSKDSVWNDFRERANRLGIMSPSAVPNFQEKSDLSVDQLKGKLMCQIEVNACSVPNLNQYAKKCDRGTTKVATSTGDCVRGWGRVAGSQHHPTPGSSQQTLPQPTKPQMCLRL